MDKDTIFLTTSQALDAICIDFRQYDPQTMLFCGVIRLISGDSIHLKREPPKNGAWVNRSGSAKMKWLTGNELIEFMCRAVRKTRWDPQLLAAVCGRVFQTRAVPAEAPRTGEPGIRIETNMAGYTCRQCGRCCRILDYHDEVTAEDVARWKALQREDILKWVQAKKIKDHDTAYRIWIEPDTGRVADPCPFLKQDPTRNRWECRIHEVKPAICRHYPISRKHAVMTGCRGFEKLGHR